MTSTGDDDGGFSATQRRYLDEAVGMLRGRQEPSYPYVLSHISAGDVSARLGWRRTALYRLWPSQTAMWDDLILHILLDATPDIANDASTDWRVEMTALQRRMRTSTAVALRTALLAYSRPPRFDQLLTWRVTTRIDAIARYLDRVLTEQDRAAVDPLTTRDLAVVLFCVADGLSYAGRLTTEVNRSVGSDGSLLASAAEALLERCTRPRTRSDRAAHLAPRPVAPMARPLFSDRQQQALEVGAEMFRHGVIEGDPVALDQPVGPISVARLARVSGVTRQAVYATFGTQRDLNLALMRYLSRQENQVVLDNARHGLYVAHRARFGGTLRATESSLEGLISAAEATSLAHLAFVPHFAIPEVNDVGRDEIERTLDAYTRDLAAVMGDRYSTRPGLDLAGLAALVLVTQTAAARLHRIDPSAVRTELAHRNLSVSALAIGIEAIVAHGLELTLKQVARGPAGPDTRC